MTRTRRVSANQSSRRPTGNRRRAGNVRARHAAEQDVARRTRAAEALQAAAERLNGSAEPDTVLLNLVNAVAQSLPCKCVRVFTREGDRACCPHAWDGETWHAPGGDVPLRGSIVGWVFEHALLYQSDDLTQDPLAGWIAAEGHQPRALLAVPLVTRDGSVSAVLAMYDRREGTPFAADDRRLAIGIAHHAAIALERARLTAELRRTTRALALLEERERVGMDLHDGAIQSLYGVMLNLAARARVLDDAMGETRAGLEQAVSQLAGVIQEIRAYISGLWSEELGARGLPTGLRMLADDLRVNARITTSLELEAELEELLRPEAVANLLQLAREAVSNVIRHAEATTVAIRVCQLDDRLTLSIRDDGRGFDPEATLGSRGEGLSNMTERARRLGGALSIVSIAEQGTEVRIELPIGSPS